MKKFFVSAALMLVGTVLFAQPRVEIRSIDRVALPDGVQVSAPTLSPNGDFVVMEANGALNRIDVATGKLTPIAETPHAFQIKISADGSQVAYLESSYKDNLRHVALKSADIASGKVTEIVKPTRHLNAGIAFSGNTVNAVEKNKFRSKALTKEKATKTAMASINYGHLDVTVDGKTTSIDPQGPGSYLWPSVSPDGTKVVYWCVGLGCFVCNLDGSNPVALGELRMPVWAGNDMVIGTLNRDNGQVITYSVLQASNLKGEKVQLTADNVIATAPSTSLDGKRVAYISGNGELFVMNLEF